MENDTALAAYSRALSTARPQCQCGGWAIISGKCGTCAKKSGLVENKKIVDRRKATRKKRDQAMRDLGMTKVRGNLGGTYWE